MDDDAAPVLDVGDVTVTEGNAGDVTASFPVTLTGATQVPVTVDVATADGSATAPGDYASLTTSLTFTPGQTAKTVDVTVHGDTTFELDETFSLHLSNPAGATIGVEPGLGTIVNDDSTPGLSVTDVSLPEGDAGDSVATFTVALGAPSAFPISVDVATADGTATQPSDYDPVATSTLTFAPGETTKTVDVTVHGDTTVEPDETFTVQLAEPGRGEHRGRRRERHDRRRRRRAGSAGRRAHRLDRRRLRPRGRRGDHDDAVVPREPVEGVERCRDHRLPDLRSARRPREPTTWRTSEASGSRRERPPRAFPSR